MISKPPTNHPSPNAVAPCIALAVLMLAVASAGAVGPDEPDPTVEGQPIVRIVFDRHNMFDTSDPKTDKWFYRAANALHIVSKEPFLRSMLLFTEGDPFSQEQADESERILRGFGFINPVDITAVAVEGGVEVTVETHDQWTLKVGASFGISGNRTDWGAEFQEDNFLGRGKKVKVEYKSDEERTSLSAGYFDPNIRGTRWRTELLYSDLSDGFRELVRVDRPFYSLATKRAWGADWERDKRDEYLYSQAEDVVSGPRETAHATAWYGLRFGAGERVTHRISLGFSHRHTTYGQWTWDDTEQPYPAPEDRLINGPLFRYERVTNQFEVVSGFRAWSIQEDIGLGPNLSVESVFSTPAFGGDIPRLVLDGTFDITKHLGNWLLLTRTWIGGRIDDGDPHNWVAGFNIGAAQLGNSGFQFRVLAEASHELDRDRQLTLGADVGLRGWSPFYFDGTGRALVNAQWRSLLIPDLFNILTLGFVVFADAGITWDPRVGPDTDGIRADAGVGLILDLPTVGLANLARIEVGFPDDQSGPTVIITTEALF